MLTSNLCKFYIWEQRSLRTADFYGSLLKHGLESTSTFTTTTLSKNSQRLLSWFFIVMVVKRKRTVYRKKRKGFSGVRQNEITIESGQGSGESSDDNKLNNCPQQQSLLTDSDDNAPVISASRKKLLKNRSEDCEAPSRENESVSLDGNRLDEEGYRFVDLQNLSIRSAFRRQRL